MYLASNAAELLKNKYWAPCIHIFNNHNRLRTLFTSKYFDVENEHIEVRKLKLASRPFSMSEKFLLNLAMHLYNERNNVNLSDMDYLDASNKRLALEAINLRFLN